MQGSSQLAFQFVSSPVNVSQSFSKVAIKPVIDESVSLPITLQNNHPVGQSEKYNTHICRSVKLKRLIVHLIERDLKASVSIDSSSPISRSFCLEPPIQSRSEPTVSNSFIQSFNQLIS